MGCLASVGTSAHIPVPFFLSLFLFFFFLVFACAGGPDQPGVLAGREVVLLWCCEAHNGTLVGMAIVLCPPR